MRVGARKEGFKKRTVAGKDRGYRLVGTFVKSWILINELISRENELRERIPVPHDNFFKSS